MSHQRYYHLRGDDMTTVRFKDRDTGTSEVVCSCPDPHIAYLVMSSLDALYQVQWDLYKYRLTEEVGSPPHKWNGDPRDINTPIRHALETAWKYEQCSK